MSKTAPWDKAKKGKKHCFSQTEVMTPHLAAIPGSSTQKAISIILDVHHGKAQTSPLPGSLPRFLQQEMASLLMGQNGHPFSHSVSFYIIW